MLLTIFLNGDAKNPQTVDYPVNVWDYFTTMGKYRRLLKVTQVGDTGFEHDLEHTIYINRISNYANGPEDDYREISVETGLEGIRIFSTNGKNDNNALNGFYYPIDKLLIYTPQLGNALFNRRIRFDFCTTLAEIMSNNIRGEKKYIYVPHGYYKNIFNESNDTKLFYHNIFANLGYSDHQGDGIHLGGLYDATITLPPVPKDGTYEIRMAGAHSSARGMCQIYFGSDPNKLMPVGLPYDMRQMPGPENPAIPWVKDTEDWDVNYEVDKKLRNQGYMKGPNYVCVSNGKGDYPLRLRDGVYGVVRRIITVADMEADKTYYLRYKSALRKTDGRLQLDFFEYASTSVFNGPKGEDIW